MLGRPLCRCRLSDGGALTGVDIFDHDDGDAQGGGSGNDICGAVSFSVGFIR